ncbi:hypothetical protein D3C85_1357280 [compost metagenome]
MWLARQPASQRSTLGHAAGKLRRVLLASVLQADRLDGVVDACTPFAGGKRGLAGEIQTEGDVAFQAQPGQQAGVLEGHRQARVRALQRLAEQADAARAGLLQAGQHP